MLFRCCARIKKRANSPGEYQTNSAAGANWPHIQARNDSARRRLAAMRLIESAATPVSNFSFRSRPVSATAAREELRFGAGHLLLAQRQLLWHGTPVKLGARAFEVLRALIERRERAVNKDELLALVWPNLVVEENNLHVHIAALRKVLGGDAIATVPGRGYRFTLAVQETPGPHDEAPADVSAPPLAEQTALAANGVVTRAGAANRATASAARAHRSNLPATSLPLFGRAADLAHVRELLADHRIVSIVGSGGIGKTRLAHAVAQSFANEATTSYPDGIWLIELAALADEQLVAASAGRVLGTPLASERSQREAVANALRRQAALLVLDNCEHVLQ